LGMSFQVFRALEGRDESIALTMPRMGLKKDRGARATGREGSLSS